MKDNRNLRSVEMVITQSILQEPAHPKTPPVHSVRTLTKVIAAQMQMLDRAPEEASIDPLSELESSD